MEIVFESKKEKILAESVAYGTDSSSSNKITLFDMGDHATHRIRGAFDGIPQIWKTTEISMIDTHNEKSVEIKAEFTFRAMEYQGDNYSRQRTMIKLQNEEKTSEDRRIIFYDKKGAIEEDKVEVASLEKRSRFGYGTLTYTLDPQTGNYVSGAGEIYHGQIANNGILEKVNMLAEKGERLVAEHIIQL